VGLRPENKRHGGMWEFPGGKRSPGETNEQAMARELDEELKVRMRRFGPLLFEARDPGSPFIIRFFEVELEGSPTPLEHSEIGWFAPEALRDMRLAPSDARFVALALPGSEGL
jgi:8-oxo-dGTP pyrophosphatase MutT (NUDIX family)